MNNKITFPRLATMLADKSGRSKRFSEDFLREFFSIISEQLESGESVKIKGLGTFRLSRVEPRKSVDVTTGQPMEISGHSKVVFIPSKEIAEAVNAPFEAFTSIEIDDNIDIEQLLSKEEEIERSEVGGQRSEFEDTEETVVFEENTPAEPESELSELSDLSDQSDELDMSDQSELPDQSDELDMSDQSELSDESDELDMSDQSELPDQSDFAQPETQQVPDEPADQEEPEEPVDQEEPENHSDQEEAAEESDQSDEMDDVEDSEFSDYEERSTRKRNWVKGLLISLGAAVIALLATFAIWYFFVTNDFNKMFNREATSIAKNSEDGFTVGSALASPEIVDTLAADSAEGNEAEESEINEEEEVGNQTEPEVPTAPSDAIVYDTISTTRYLTTMAKKYYGNYNLWPYIYEENKAKLGHPDRIRPGTPVVIPKLSKYGVDPTNAADIEKAKKMGVAIYAKYGKSI